MPTSDLTECYYLLVDYKNLMTKILSTTTDVEKKEEIIVEIERIDKEIYKLNSGITNDKSNSLYAKMFK